MLHNVLHARYATNILLVPPHTHTHDLHGRQDPHESGQESYVPPVGAYSEEADPEWTDSQPEPILPSPEYELPHTQPDESEEEAWEGPPVPEIPEETPKAKSEIEGAEVDSEDEILTRERFLEVVVKDESLGMDRQGATKVYSYLRNKMKELGIVFGPLEMKQQLSLGSTTPTPKDPLAEPMSSKPDAAVLRDLEEKHSHFDSSQGSTVQRGSDWAESPDRTLEEKIEAVPEKDAYAVAVQHEMNQEKERETQGKKGAERNSGLFAFFTSTRSPQRETYPVGANYCEGAGYLLGRYWPGFATRQHGLCPASGILFVNRCEQPP